MSREEHGRLSRGVGRQGGEEVGDEGQGEERRDLRCANLNEHRQEGLEQGGDVGHLGGEEVVDQPIGGHDHQERRHLGTELGNSKVINIQKPVKRCQKPII